MLFAIYSVYFFCFCFMALNACRKQKSETEPCTYTSQVKPIIAAKCSLPDCHGAGSLLGDFTNYESLKVRVDNGRLRLNVFELKIMPPASVDTLTSDEKEVLKCWIDNGAKQD
jgi:uncharacterized membrane protein